MAAGPRVLLGLRDAAVAGPRRGGGQGPAWAINKLGGAADWVPSVQPSCPHCMDCGQALVQLVQVYCPLEHSPFHRVAHVFACAGKDCGGTACSWKVLRSQYLQAGEKETADCGVKQEQELNFAATDWCDGADDWGVCDGAESPACASLQLLGLNDAVNSSLSREVECASQLQQLHLSEAADRSLNAHPPVGEGVLMATSTSAPAFQPFYISVVDEEDYTGFLDTDHANKLLKEYQQREGVDLEQLMSESFAGEGDNEKYEKSEIKNRDHTFHKFMKRISVCPEQILRSNAACPVKLSQCSDGTFVHQVSRTRYSWGGQPLFITCPPANIDRGIPACSNCGSNRVFEFQLMPALVSMLRSDSDLSVEFGTAIVYTCEKSCWPTNHQTPLEEFIFIQEDPDQRLFK